MYAICHLSIVPVRKEPADRSELVTQLLFGDLLEIISEAGNWRNIRIMNDGYEGWVDWKQIRLLSDEQALIINSCPVILSDDIVHSSTLPNESYVNIVLGSQLPLLSDSQFELGGQTYLFAGKTIRPNRPSAISVRNQAMKYLNTPYLWGGKSPFGIDCSGFTQMVYRLNGISLPRDTWQQAATGQPVAWEDGLQEGDLAFFSNAEGKVIHVGIILTGLQIIHASGMVRIDSLIQSGIQHGESRQQTHSLHSIRRFF